MAATPTKEQLLSIPSEYLAENNGHKLTRTSISFTILLIIVYLLFIISRLFFSQKNGWHIWVLYPLGCLFSLALAIICLYFVKIGGAGRHVSYWLIHDPSIIGTFLKLQTATEFVYMAGITFPKVSILLLYLQVFTSRRVRLITWVVLGVVVGHFVFTGIIATFTICQPFAYKWDKSIPDGHCADLMAAYKYISIPNILTDVLILVLPFPTLRQLQTSKSRKFGIFLTFLTGSLGIITSVLRFVGFYTTDLQSDLTYLGVNTMIYTLVEPSAYFICSCLPGIRPLLVAVFNHNPNKWLKATLSGHQSRSQGLKPERHYKQPSFINMNPGHVASVSTSDTSIKPTNNDETTSIRLYKTVQVSHTHSRGDKF